MTEERQGSGWAAVSRRVEEEMVSWRQSHPRASLTEIELAVEAATAKLRAQLITDLAQGMDAPVAGEGGTVEPPRCLHCQEPLHRRGRRVREMMVAHQERPLKLERDYFVCPTCGAGLSPPG